MHRSRRASPAVGTGDSSEHRKRPRLGRDDSQNSNPSSNPPPAVACDQCKSRKVRYDRRQPCCSSCMKTGVECSRKNDVKRENHAKILRNDFSSVLDRLDNIDETLIKLTTAFNESSHPLASSDSNPSYEHAHEHLDSLPLASNAQSSHVGLGSVLVLPSSQPDLGQSTLEKTEDPRLSAEDQYVTETVELEVGERAYKDPAALSLLVSVSRRLASICHVGADITGDNTGDKTGYRATSSIREMMLRQLECFPIRGKCNQPIISNDCQPVIAPPQLITRLFIDGYLRDINTRFPIFDEKHLRDAIDIHYSNAPADEQVVGSPWPIIFNNIALLELGQETQVTRWQAGSAGASSVSTCPLTDDLVSSLLYHCDRAFADLTAYMRPSLLHVQALSIMVSSHSGRSCEYFHTARSYVLNTSYFRIVTSTSSPRILQQHVLREGIAGSLPR
ncbi:hypothetical protein GGR52DRAFT_439093 [Hypoxylon sp. FL1284]|nr:hypothetical protein GGR52DRAFT_439093 [Hypoxylon sp. FL1284]